MILAVCSASAQSSPSTDQASPSLFAPGESSSSTFQFVADDGLSGAGALRSAAASLGYGGGAAAGQEEKSSKHGSSRSLALEFGGGFNAPIGNDTSTVGGGPFITWGGNFTAGGGLHFTRRFSLLAEYQFIDDKLPGSLIAEVGTQGGNAHIWSLTLDPVIDLFPKKTNSIYVTGGGGFYRKLTSFTVPVEGEECYFYCGIYIENQTVFHFSSNQGGANAGIGYTHRLGGTYGDSKTKLYAEARYLFVNTPSLSSTNGTGTTELIPVTLGVRW
jgi:hypothetical protein